MHADTRDEAIAKMRRALEEMIISPIKTNIDFQYEIMNHPIFQEGDVDTGFINEYFFKHK